MEISNETQETWVQWSRDKRNKTNTENSVVSALAKNLQKENATQFIIKLLTSICSKVSCSFEFSSLSNKTELEASRAKYHWWINRKPVPTVFAVMLEKKKK